MSQHATAHDHVTYRPGDGAPLEVPPGPIEVELSPDAATLSWVDDNGATGATAIPLKEYKTYLKEKQITLDK